MLLPSLLPPLRLTAPPLSGRADNAVTLSTVARLVASGTAVSKADLVPATGLARTTVSTAVDELVSRGVLCPDGTRPTAGRGRPADRLALSPRGGHVLLADVGASGAHLAVIDLSQQVLGHTHVDVDVKDGPEVVLAAVVDELAALRTGAVGAAALAAPVRAVVIGLPGPVDGQLGIPVRPPIMPGWHAYPVSARLRAIYGCPVILENDVNLRALGEARALPAGQAPLLFVKVGTGIGGGLITREGALHHGADGAAGDIGHIRVRGAPDVVCICGNVGCIEAVASANAIARRLTVDGPDGADPVTIAEVRTRLARADPAALAMVREAAALIGEVVATLVHFYNPARVTLGGSVTAASDELLAGVRSVVYQRALPLATRNLVLVNSVLGEYAGLAGAMVLGIEQVLSATDISTLM